MCVCLHPPLLHRLPLFPICQPCAFFCFFKPNHVRTDKTVHIPGDFRFVCTKLNRRICIVLLAFSTMYDLLPHCEDSFLIPSGCLTFSLLPGLRGRGRIAFSRSTNRIMECVQHNYHKCVVAPSRYTGMQVSLPESDK